MIVKDSVYTAGILLPQKPPAYLSIFVWTNAAVCKLCVRGLLGGRDFSVRHKHGLKI